MIQAKTIAMLLLIAIATIGAIGIGTTEHAFAFGGRAKITISGNNNNQGSSSMCFGWVINYTIIISDHTRHSTTRHLLRDAVL